LEVIGVIKIMEKHAIIQLYEKGESFRGISRLLGVDRKTISKYCKEYDAHMKLLKDASKNEIREIQEKIVSSPSYNSSNRKNKKYTKEIDDALNFILESEREKNHILGKYHKQQLTKKQIYDELIEKGFEIGKTTIYNKINEKLEKGKECFVKQKYDLGERLEFDFGEVILVIHEEKIKYYLAVLSSPASNFRWCYLYRNQKKESFLNAHVEFFEMVKGVYKEVVYDNMKNVVSKFLGKNEKILNEDLIKMSLYYGFEINVTNAFSGNEKGFVESSVKVLRKEIFGPRYKFNTEEEAKAYLKSKLIKLNESSEIEKEKIELLSYRPKLDLGEIRIVTINKYGFARMENNSYSVPDYLVDKKITAKIYYDIIKFYSNNHFICEHKKRDGSNEISIDIRHYLNTFDRKPGSIKNSLALKSIPQLKTIYDIYFKSNPRKFVALLKKYKELNMEEIIYKLKNYEYSSDDSERVNNSIKEITQNQLHLYKNLYFKEVN